MINSMLRKIVFADGTEFFGQAFGARTNKASEIVFNTSMTGYQEILSDPSYTGQAVVMTYPLIGNYGITKEDFESVHLSPDVLIVDGLCETPSNFRCIEKLEDAMLRCGVIGISHVDTRKLTRKIRESGSQMVIITDASLKTEEAKEMLAGQKQLKNPVSLVSTKKKVVYKADKEEFSVALIDCGMKRSILTSLLIRNCSVTVFPYSTTAKEILLQNPDGLMISNGPGDPTDVSCVAETIKELHGKLPIFGICLGHQLIGLSYGAKCYKLRFGHHGGNHPVKNLITKKIEITSQNHSYALLPESLKKTEVEITHLNLLDNSIEGIRCLKDRVFSVQFHPESAPGPEDSCYLFDEFFSMIREES